MRVLSVMVSVYFILICMSFKTTVISSTFDQSFKTYFSTHNTTLIDDVMSMYKYVQKESFKPDSAKKYLAESRKEYKYIEAYVRYFLPGDARLLNNAVILQMEEDDEVSAYVAPHGFQYLEQMLYSDSVKFFQRKLKDEIDEIYGLIGRFNESISYMEFRERDVFEAMQLQLVKQFMLGIANFETADSRMGVVESAVTLDGFKECLRKCYPERTETKSEHFDTFAESVDAANRYLYSIKPADDPDFFVFYSRYYIPVSETLGRMRDLSVAENDYNASAINFQVRSVFDPHAFNSYFFLPGKQLTNHIAVIELGRTLFFDPALSANNLRACASCHQSQKAFTDGLALSQSFEPGKMLTRNAPTVVNAVLQRKLFHDGRAFTFEDQAGQVMSNPLEMHNDFSQVAVKLRNSPGYVEWFRAAYAGSEDTIITNRSILTAIAEYERSLIGTNSRFDRTITGRADVMSPDEKAGFNIFMGKGNCASCHFLPLFNGTMPPEYVETEWEILGVPGPVKNGKQTLDDDIGRAKVIDVPIFYHAFKTPTLRNVELTGPYMHNGVFRTLEEVIEFYDHGGGRGLGYKVPYQTLPSDSLHLTSTEKFQLIEFLKSLTDTATLTKAPTSLPLFTDDPLLNKRPIGGDY
jgi:cytochrome c peroxidase